jgi:ubiquitin-like 1-activating enzyme E1 B
MQLSNLNRQFLFKQQHKGMSKALVAKESVLKLNPTLNIEAHHMNIKDLPIAFFRQFDILVLALDNI